MNKEKSTNSTCGQGKLVAVSWQFLLKVPAKQKSTSLIGRTARATSHTKYLNQVLKNIRKQNRVEIYMCILVSGEYRIGLKFNDEHIPDSPFKVYISPAVGDAHLLEVAQFPEGSIQADKPSQFIVRRNGAKGDLDAKVCYVSSEIYFHHLSVSSYPFSLFLSTLEAFFNIVDEDKLNHFEP